MFLTFRQRFTANDNGDKEPTHEYDVLIGGAVCFVIYDETGEVRQEILDKFQDIIDTYAI